MPQTNVTFAASGAPTPFRDLASLAPVSSKTQTEAEDLTDSYNMFTARSISQAQNPEFG